MNPRLTLFSAATAALLAPLLYDIAIKGVLLLVAAGLVVLGLRRASAAARHLVWLVALVALLAVPVLTVALPGWRVLPAWAAWPERPAESPPMMPSAAPTIARVEAEPAATSMPAPPGSSFMPAPAPIEPQPEFPDPAPTRRAAYAPVSSPTPTPSAAAWVVAGWTGGFLILVVRLVAAQWMLWRARRRAEPCQTGPLAEAMAEAANQLGLRQRVCLRLDARRTIPLVWGVLRPCLLLPAEARGWGCDQLRSVLLHELAHIKRRDPLVQALAQGTLALHWFNPLAWFAVWRLHVERERACDDLVLASGVRGSEYAIHLLRVASELTPARWTSACGLAMARRSSLEGRLLAVLNDRCDRRGMTRALTAAALLLSLALAIPVAMLKATEAPRKPLIAALPPSTSVEQAGKPKHESAQSLLQKWQSRARTDGKIPGALVGQLAQKIEEFIKQYPDASETPKLMGLRPRFEAAAARDWRPDEIAGLLDDVAAIATAPLGWSSLPLEFDESSTLNIPAPLQDTMKQAFNVAGAAVQEPNAPHFAGGAKLDPLTEAQLDWGEASFGLRGALLIRSPGAGKPEGIYLVVQNVSDGPRRFMDTTKSERLRTLYLSDTKGILAGLSNDEPTMSDVTLQPREVVFLNMMRSDGSAEVSAGLIEGIRKDSLQKWFAVLRMEFSVLGGGWSGTLTTGESRCAVRDGGPLPKNDRAQALFKVWQSSARLNGDIPGGLVRLLHEKVKEFIRNNEPDASGGPYAQRMKPLEPRFANTSDWKPADLVVLLDDIAAAHTIPLDNTLRHLAERTLYPGTPLPASLENADWGEPLPSGLRVAHLLEPRAGAYHLGTELKARILFHNVGKEPVTFITDTFQQPGHSAQRADGNEIKLEATYWTTLGSMAAYRLAPGEYCEIHTPGLGIGAQVKGRDDWANVRAGSWILCEEGDEVVFTPGAAALSYHEMPDAKSDWWLEFITERLNLEAPAPTDTKEREYLLYRVVRDLYGAAPSTTEGDAFAADTSPEALKNLAALIAKHPYGKRSDGVVRAGSTTFRVLPSDPDADKRPRLATGPGWYSLSDTVKFSVTRSAAGSRVINEASIIHFQQGQDNVVHKVALPNGYDTWAAGMMKGATELWIAEAGTLRKYDFANPLQPLETRYEAGTLSDAPISKELRGLLNPVLSQPAPDVPKLKRSSPPPAEAPATPAAEKPKGGAAPAAVATPPPAAADHVRVALTKDGVITYGRRGMTLDELCAAAKVDAKKWFTIDADTDVPFARVTEVVEALKSSGVTEIAFQAARVGDGRYRVANRTGSYKFDGQHKFSICKLTSGPHRFAVTWPAKDGQPLRTLRMYPQNGEQTRGKWAVVWEPGAEVLWWIDDSHVGKMTVTDPTAVVVDRESRSGAFSQDFALPEGVLTEFRRLGFEVGGGSGAAKRTREVLKAEPASTTQTAEAHEEGLVTPDGLLGTWRGTVNGEKLTLSFHRPPAEEEVHCNIYFGEATIGVLAGFTIAEDGGSAVVVQHTAGGGMKFGTLIPSEAGKLKLELYGRQKGEQETMLTRDAEPVASEPRQNEARELFDMWKRTANDDGTIPGTFIGLLATEVRAYVKANPTLDSAAKLPKLLPRFVTSRDWTQAEAVTLLDDVAYYSTKPIEACVAKAKLASGPLWRTMVEFQDSPVEIAKWSEVKDGLRLGLRVVGGQWSAGGSVRVELWLHNAGDKDVTFHHIGRNDIGLQVKLRGADGKEHDATIAQYDGYPVFTKHLLKAGHAFKAREFTVRLAKPADSTPDPWFALPAGAYTFRCELNIPGTTATDATGTQRIPAEGEWSGTIKTGEVAVKLVAADEHRAVRKNAVGTATPAFAAPGLHPTSTRLWNDTHAAYAVQSEKEVNFVLLYEGVLSTGMSESWSGTTDYWAFEGSIHLVDREKTAAAGQNVDKRVIAVKYASDAPTMLYLDGKAYDLANPPAARAKGVGPLPGRLFILREEGDPIQTDRTLPLRHEQDLATLGTFARQDRVTDTAREGTRQTPKGGGVALAINPANSPSASKEVRTVDVTIEATVARPLSGLKDFDLEITGHLHSASTDPSRSPWRWKNQSPITGGRLVVPIPAGLTDVKLTAGPVGSRPGDSPVFVWQREAPVLSDWIGLGTVTEPVHFRLRVEDAAELRVTVKAPDGGKPTNVRLDARTEGGSVAPLALTEWNQADTRDAFVRAIRLPACERVQLNVLADLSAPATQKFGPLAAGEVTEVHVALQEARDLHWIATGRVIDPDGKPMAGVLIAVHAGMGSLRQTGRATTDADGRYTVRFSPGIRGGTQTHLLQFANITAHKPGFVEKNLNAHGAGAMAIGESARQDFMAFGMKPDQLALRGKPRTVDFSMRPVE